MKNFLTSALAILLICLVNPVSAQVDIYWEESLGGSLNDQAHDILPTSDGNYLIIGTTDSDDDDVSASMGQQDVWVVKVNPEGEILWEKSYGGSLNDYAKDAVVSASGDEYVIAGSTYSTDGDVTGNNGQRDAWVLKINNAGELQWAQCFGGDTVELFNGIISASGGGYLCMGNATSVNDDLTGNNGGTDLWCVKIDEDGNLSWQKNYGGSFGDFGFHAAEGADGYMLAGYSYSNDLDVSGHHGDSSTSDYWILKTDLSGDLSWQKSCGGDYTDVATKILYKTDGNYIIAGKSYSDNGDISSHHGTTAYTDAWLLELDDTGTIVTEKSIGGSYDDEANSISYDTDGGFILAGNSESSDGDLTDHFGTADSPDFILYKLNSDYSVAWTNNFGGLNDDIANAVYPYGENYYLAVGHTKSISGDVEYHHGSSPNFDYWLVNFNPCTPQVLTQPADISSCVGSSVTLTASTNPGSYYYTWIFTGAEYSTYDTTVTISDLTAAYEGSFYFVAESSCGSVTSETATLTLSSLAIPEITPSAGGDICESGSVEFTCVSTDPDYSYQWFNGSSAISGATLSTYLCTGAGSYTIVIMDSEGCTSTSSPVTVTQSLTDATITITGTTNLCAGSTVDFSTETGSGYIYQWYKDAAPISGATASSYTASAAGTYYVETTYGFCSAVSENVTVTENDLDALIDAPDGLDLCNTGFVTINNTTPGSFAFQWLFNGEVLVGETSSFITVSDTGSYALILTTTSGCIDTSEAVVVYNSCVSTHDIEFSNVFEIYPNPSNGNFTLSMKTEIPGELQIVLYDVIGNIVVENSLSENDKLIFNLQHITSGQYTIRVTGNNFATHKNITIIN